MFFKYEKNVKYVFSNTVDDDRHVSNADTVATRTTSLSAGGLYRDQSTHYCT